MTPKRDLAKQALELSEAFRKEATRKLLDAAGGDSNAVMKAVEVVRRSNPNARQSERGTEHIAFSLLTEVFDRIAQDRSASPDL